MRRFTCLVAACLLVVLVGCVWVRDEPGPGGGDDDGVDTGDDDIGDPATESLDPKMILEEVSAATAYRYGTVDRSCLAGPHDGLCPQRCSPAGSRARRF